VHDIKSLYFVVLSSHAFLGLVPYVLIKESPSTYSVLLNGPLCESVIRLRRSSLVLEEP